MVVSLGEYAQSSSAVLFLRSFKTLGHCSQQVVAVYSAGVLKGLFQSHFPFRQVPSLANRALLRNGFCHNALSLRIAHRRRDFCNGLVSPVPSFHSGLVTSLPCGTSGRFLIGFKKHVMVVLIPFADCSLKLCLSRLTAFLMHCASVYTLLYVSNCKQPQLFW